MSVTVTSPARGPDAVGVNVTAMVQLAPLARLVPQLVVSAKSPLAMMLVMFRTAPPVLVRITFCGGLVVLTIWLAKVKLDGRKATAGAADPLPASRTV